MASTPPTAPAQPAPPGSEAGPPPSGPGTGALVCAVALMATVFSFAAFLLGHGYDVDTALLATSLTGVVGSEIAVRILKVIAVTTASATLPSITSATGNSTPDTSIPGDAVED